MMFGETRMKKFSLLHIAAALLSIPIFVFLGTHSRAESNELLRLVQTISIPTVKGRLDHLDVDVKGQRLFVSALENGTVEAVNLETGKWIRSIPGFKKPQGISYVPSLNKFFIASGDDGMVRVFRGDTFELVDSIQLELGPGSGERKRSGTNLDLRSGRLGDEGLILLFCFDRTFLLRRSPQGFVFKARGRPFFGQIPFPA